MIRIGPLQVDLERRQLLLDDEPVRLGSRAFDILAVLVAADGALVSKNDLLAAVWPDTLVEENNLQVHMSALRKVLGANRVLIQTVSGRGYRLVRTRQPADAPTSVANAGVAHNLPSNTSPLVGRDTAIADILLALEAARHVTLIGAGGIGKTRLAIEAGRRSLDRFPDGVYLVSLSPAQDLPSVLAAFTGTLGINPAAGSRSLAVIAQELRERRMLVLLDNCEHVLTPAASLADALCTVSDSIRVLATSREPLKVVSEHLYWVAPLSVPAPSASGVDIKRCSAVQLFLARARAIDLRFSCDERSMELIGTVCRRLDGIPLAIELAASRATILGVETLAAHLDDRFRMLTGGNRTALPRHQTLRATLDWSHALLDDAERTTLRRLGIFVADFSMEAAVAIVGDDALREFDVIAAVSGLVEKSLVARQTGNGRAAYRLLESTRAYALQKLDDNGERQRVSLGHANHFASLLNDDAQHGGGHHSEGWQRRMRDMLGDLRAALTWTLSPKGDAILAETLCVKFVSLLFELSLVEECCVWARRSLAALQTGREAEAFSHRCMRVRMRLQAALAAALVYVHGPDKETRALWSEVLALSLALADRVFEARALWGMWNASQSAGEVRSALSFARRFAALAADSQTTDAEPESTDVLLGYRLLGIASHYAGEQAKARASLEHFLQHAARLQTRMPLGRSVDQRIVGEATLARVLWLQGARDEARRLAEACVVDACAAEQAIVTAYVLIEARIPLALLSREREAARQAIDMLLRISMRTGLNVAQACGAAFDAYLISLDDITPDVLQAFDAALKELDTLGFNAPRSMLAAQYARALGQAGRHGEAIDTTVRALKRCNDNGDAWYASELLRTQGELLLMGPPGEAVSLDAEVCFASALETASMQGSDSFYLTAATSYARHLHVSGRNAQAMTVLETACARFPQWREWDDFRAALRLLNTLKTACDSADSADSADSREARR
ncbi:winged helix-turn-helix domain-containing protein [Caballeronia sp. GAWG1-1]|uniref:ATP-binding protein n=1 Tax=Caballeronia sp. GAWG1-1 TaxID=2921742 RepID=UPI0020282485|nr:winged helix-turn-helix domain-containing protein [Caballeronia sp. GAWG1-1]